MQEMAAKHILTAAVQKARAHPCAAVLLRESKKLSRSCRTRGTITRTPPASDDAARSTIPAIAACLFLALELDFVLSRENRKTERIMK